MFLNNFALKAISFSIISLGLFTSQGQAQITTFPHSEDFETFVQCGGTCASVCTLNNNWTNQGVRDFSSDVSGTSSGSTGPTANGGADHNPGISGGRYLYAETSSPCNSSTNEWLLHSPTINLAGTNAIQYQFWYHMYGATQGTAHVDVSDDGGTTWSLDVIPAWGGNQGDIWQMKNIDLSAFTGTVIVRTRYNSSTSFTGDFAIDDVYIYDLLPLNIGITAIDSPAVPTCNLGNDVWVTLENSGTTTTNTATVQWEVDGTMQTPFNFSGGSVLYNTDTTFMIGTSSVTILDGSTIKAWTELPNGSLETNTAANTNDTIETILSTGLNGVYTIGGITPDYTTINDARIALETFGICGPTTFNIRSGTYNEQVIFTEVLNADSINTITFTSEDNNADSVLWTATGTVNANRGTITLNGADYFHFHKLTVENSATTYRTAVHLYNEANWNEFTHNILLGDSIVNSTTENFAVIYSNISSSESNNTFDNNTIWGGSYGSCFYGNSTANAGINNSFTNNWFKNQYYMGLRFQNHVNITVNNNRFNTNSNYTGTSYAVFLRDCDSTTNVSYNEIESATGNGSKYGLYIYNNNGNAINNSLIANNMIHVGDTGNISTCRGIYMYNTRFLNILNNNILVEGSNNNSQFLYGSNGNDNTLMNNNLVNTGNGYGLYIQDSLTLTNSDYNNIYVPNGIFAYTNGSNRVDLTALQTQGLDTNSLNVDPMYKSSSDLHVCSDSIDGMGSVNTLITTDFDGDLRDTSTPDIGADEFRTLNNYSLGLDTAFCTGDSLFVFSGASPSDAILWSTGETTNSIWITTTGNYFIDMATCGTNVYDTISVTIETIGASFTQTLSALTATFTNTSTGILGNGTYLWNFGDGDTSSLENPIHTYATDGTYSVSLTITGECGTDTTMIDVDISTVGIDETTTENTFNMYPNPATNNLNIDVQITENSDAILHISDITGRIIVSENFNAIRTGKTTLPVNLSELNSGTYFVVLNINKQVFTQKLSILK